DEDPAIDLAEVDDVLAPVDEGVERSDDIVAVHPQVESEVVARTRGDAGVGQTVGSGRSGDDRLSTVPTRRCERVRAPGDRIMHKPLQIVTPVQLHSSDPAFGSFLGQSYLGRLPVTR